MQYKIGQKVRARFDQVETFPGGVTRTIFRKRQVGYIAGIVTYDHGGPLHFLISNTDPNDHDWEEYPAPKFWKSFQLLH